jgi:hypothetical protein
MTNRVRWIVALSAVVALCVVLRCTHEIVGRYWVTVARADRTSDREAVCEHFAAIRRAKGIER